MKRGREIVRDTLWIKQGKDLQTNLAEVVLYCATHDHKKEGQLEIFEEVTHNYQKPKRVVRLTEINEPGVQEMSSTVSVNSIIATSPYEMDQRWPFQIVLKNGDVFEFFAKTKDDSRHWVKYLKLLLVFPYSPIPDEPEYNPIKDGFRAKLNPLDFNAASVWPVYILPEEVGSRINALGLHIVALKNISENHPGRLDIISPTDPTTPIVSWNRDRLRRTGGGIGSMVFVEIGRRCTGGPGLIWMYVGPKDMEVLKEILHTFLFTGDGSIVPISTEPEKSVQTFSHNEFSSHVNKESSASDQQSPSNNATFRQLDCTRRPSLQSTQHNTTHDTKYKNIDLDSGISSRNSSQRDSIISDSTVHNSVVDEDCLFEFDTDDLTVKHLDSEAYNRHSVNLTCPRSVHIRTHRSHSTSTCHPYQHANEYEKMINPKVVQKDEYVEMRSVTRLHYAQPGESSHPIKERDSQDGTSNYENFSIASNGPNKYYYKQYENTEHFQEKRSGSNHSIYGPDHMDKEYVFIRSTSPTTNKTVRHVYGSAV